VGAGIKISRCHLIEIHILICDIGSYLLKVTEGHAVNAEIRKGRKRNLMHSTNQGLLHVLGLYFVIS